MKWTALDREGWLEGWMDGEREGRRTIKNQEYMKAVSTRLRILSGHKKEQSKDGPELFELGLRVHLSLKSS